MTAADFEVLRETLGLNWKTLADNLGVSERELRRYRRGEITVPYKVWLAAQGLICQRLHAGRPLLRRAG